MTRAGSVVVDMVEPWVEWGRGPEPVTPARAVVRRTVRRSVDDGAEQLHGLVPRGFGVGIAGIDLLDGRTKDLLLDHGVIRSLELGVDPFGTLGEDLTHRCVVEYRREIARAGHPWIAPRLAAARECTCSLERDYWVVRSGEPLAELRRFLGVSIGG